MKDDENNCINTEQLKENFKPLQKEYNLPEFKQLDEDFDISKIDADSETLLREIRKMMNAKFLSLLQFVELLLNPTSGSMFHLCLVKGINSEERKILSDLFEKLGEIEISSFDLDVNYSEKKESEFISLNFNNWQQIKVDLTKIVDSLKINWKKVVDKKIKGYFG